MFLSKTINKLAITLIFFLILVILFDPSNNLTGLKTPLFLVVFLSFFFLAFIRKSYQLRITKSFFLLETIFSLISLYGFLVGLLYSGEYDFGYAFYYAFVFAPFVLLYFLLVLDVNFEKVFINALKFFSVLLFLFSIAVMWYFDELSIVINALNFQYQVAMIGYRDYGGITFSMIYWKTSIMIVFLSAYLMDKRGVFSILFFLVTLYLLFISGTRANMFIAFLFFIWWILLNLRVVLTKSSYKASVLFLLFMFFLVLIASLDSIFGTFLSPNETSNAIKLGHFQSYLSLFSDNLSTFLFGAGYGSGMYSYGTGSNLFSLELTYLEILRFYGVFVALIFISILIYPIFILYRNKSTYLYGWLSYLLIAGSNPLILSSTGVFALIFVYYLVFKKEMYAN